MAIPNQNLLGAPISAGLGANTSLNVPATPQVSPQQSLPPQNLMQQPTPGVEQSALNGGGAGNKQQVSNFMTALHNVGAGHNNTQMNSNPAPQQQPIQPLVNPNAASANNGGQDPNFNTATSQSSTYVNPQVQESTQDPSLNVNLPIFNTPATNTSAVPQGNLPNASNLQPIPQPSAQRDPWYGSPTVAPPAPPPPPNVPYGPNQFNINPDTLVSDETLKTNIKPGNKDINSFLNSINAHNYEYKNPTTDGVGVFTSPMAQELEKTELGKQAVIDTPRGKMVNYPRLGAVNLAAVSVVHKENVRLQEQVDNLRKQFKLIMKKDK